MEAAIVDNVGMKVTAQTVTPHVQRWLQTANAAVLLHRFEAVINLMNATGDIISVVQPQVQAGPFSLVVDVERPFPHTLSPHTPVSQTAASLIIGPLHIDCRPAHLWHPVPNWQRLQATQANWHSILPEMATAVTHHLHQIGTIGPAIFAQQFQAAAAQMQAIQQKTDRVAWQTAVTQLAGLGPGFTPAGDDFLVGFLFGLWATRPRDEVEKLAEIVVETAVPRTTQLSAAWLQAAGRGEAWLPWHGLVNALSAGHDWQPPVQRILAQGASSGVAALLGFIAAARFL
ncbi:MAG: DUF2877 domain-containing protein [Chloroflexota bacterium]